MRKMIQWWLERYVVRYFRKNSGVKLAVVVGAAGKTTTKNAIATVLEEKYRVRVERGNLNEQMAVPLSILGVEYPAFSELRSLKTWMRVFAECRKRLGKRDDVDVIVQELGTDHPGEIPHFAEYLRPNIAVVTAIVPEHMEYFRTLDAVAEEELAIVGSAGLCVVNRDDTPKRYLENLDSEKIAFYDMSDISEFRSKINLLGEHSLKTAAAAVVVARELGLSRSEISGGLGKIRAVNGRMNKLAGKNGTVLIDDTYNSSPDTAIAALKTLYGMKAPQRIAVLGSMNELGDYSEEAHRQVAEFVDAAKVDVLVTVGVDAGRWLATSVKMPKKRVYVAENYAVASKLLRRLAKPRAAILFKGSQNGVFLEEALKTMLKNPRDQKYLVRQGENWVGRK